MYNNNMNCDITITLTPYFWDRKPNLLIIVNGKIIENKFDFLESGTPINLKYNIDLQDVNKLQICLQNKTNDQTVVENKKIVKDQWITLDDIEIDGVVLHPSMLLKGKFQPFYPKNLLESENQLPKYVSTTQFNYNGIYELNFSMPIHVWFFENLD